MFKQHINSLHLRFSHYENMSNKKLNYYRLPVCFRKCVHSVYDFEIFNDARVNNVPRFKYFWFNISNRHFIITLVDGSLMKV